MSIETYGRGERLATAKRYSCSLSQNRHIVLLPVPTSRDKKYVTGTEILLEDTLANVGDGSIVAGYLLPAAFKERIAELGGLSLDLAENEEFLKSNAIITAEGTLGYILTTEKRALRDLRIGVVGYGRIGSSLVEMLLFLGARVRVYSSRVGLCLELSESGVDAAVIKKGGGVCDFSDIDILINTAPTDMKHHFSSGIEHCMRVLELASGDNFNGVSGVEYLPALPEKMYPESAGRIYFSALYDFIKTTEANK